jgi:hypothetical protein
MHAIETQLHHKESPLLLLLILARLQLGVVSISALDRGDVVAVPVQFREGGKERRSEGQ